MVKQGDIIKLDFNPQIGHEQAGYRPAIVVSNNFFNEKTSMTLVCPVTNGSRSFPLHIPLDERTETTGMILCEQLKAVDLAHRKYNFVERLPDDLRKKVVEIVISEINQ